MSRIVVYGASDQGRCTVDVIEQGGRDEVVGFLDDIVPAGTQLDGHPVLGSGTDVAELREAHGFDAAIVAIGDNFRRSQVAGRLAVADPTLAFAVAVHPSAVIGRDVRIGDGTILMAGTVVNGSATIGRHVMLCARSSLDHDSEMQDFASLAPAATTGGRVHIGHHTAVGLGASIIHSRTIGDHSVIGAGSTVVRDIAGHTVAYGTPCRPVRERREDDPYL